MNERGWQEERCEYVRSSSRSSGNFWQGTGLWLFASDSITVSSAWELISVSMCYPQGDGCITSLFRLCTVLMST